MEVLQWSGLRTVLFLSPPAPEQLAKFPGLQALGIAGTSRSMSPEQMRSVLPGIFHALKSSGAEFVHYKTCSTFDSSPYIGSIGLATELGYACFHQRPVPVIVGAPHLGRYQAFGNLFAKSGVGRELYRLDRHPTMAQHPVTPMQEADLRRILAAQTSLPIELVDLLDMDRANISELVQRIDAGPASVVLLDVLTEQHLTTAGQILAGLSKSNTEGAPRFLVGSSGVVAALTDWWRSSGVAQPSHKTKAFAPVEQLLVFTGSCSPINARQMDAAEDYGFRLIAMDTAQLVHEATAEREAARVITAAIKLIDDGANVIVHSSRGAGDQRNAQTLQALHELGLDHLQTKLVAGQILGKRFGSILREILKLRSFQRVGIAGGDTSGYIAGELAIEALEAIAPFTPGVPLCRAHAPGDLDGLELVLKGGQVGPDDVWPRLLNGS